MEDKEESREPQVAIALRYLPGETDAPVVVASGRGEIAKEILKRAALYKIPVTENPPLARMLIRVPLDHPVPVELYEAVALVLAHLYRYPGRNSSGKEK